MENIVGIRFESCGKVYAFKADGLELKRGEAVVVESELGMSIGRVVYESYSHPEHERDFKPVLRRATDDDIRQQADNASIKGEAFDFCIERIKARGLPMKLVATDATLDRKRMIFYFVAEGRIDFRELVKDLAARFRTRIELRQIGVRDAARMVGGIGLCGMDFCCRRFLVSFEPISIKMAKRQELALNASKLSGLCGRLMCCLGYERGKEGPAVEAPEEKAPAAIIEAAPPQAPQAAPAKAEPPKEEGQPQQPRSKHKKRRWGKPKKK